MQACLDMLAWHMLPEALAFVEAQQARFPLDYRFAALRALIHREQGESASAITALLSMGSFQRVLPGHLQTRQWQVMYSRQSAREVDLQHVQTALAQAMTYQEMLARRLRGGRHHIRACANPSFVRITRLGHGAARGHRRWFFRD